MLSRVATGCVALDLWYGISRIGASVHPLNRSAIKQHIPQAHPHRHHPAIQSPHPSHHAPKSYEVRTHRLQQLENHIAIPLVSTSPSIRKQHARLRPRRALSSYHVCEEGKGRNGTYIGGNKTLRPPPPPPPRPVIFTSIFFLSFFCVETICRAEYKCAR